MLFYDPTSFPKKRSLQKEMKPSKSLRKEKIGKDTKSIRNAKDKNQILRMLELSKLIFCIKDRKRRSD